MEDLNFQFVFQYAENIVYAVALLIFVGFEIWLINRGAKYFKRKIAGWNFQSFKIQSFELLATGKQKLAINGFISAIQVLAIVSVIYISLILALSIFPNTESVAIHLINLIFLPLQSSITIIGDYIPSLFTIIVIVVIFRYLVKIVKTISKEVHQGNMQIPGFESHWAKTTAGIIIFMINTFMLILIFPYLPGYESLAFKGIITFLGAMITIGGSSIIANYMAGIVMTYMNSHQVGDWVSIDETTGEITEISPFAIKIRTPKQVIVSIPNAKILNTHIKNYSRELGHRTLLHTTISIGYEVPWKKVNGLLLSAAKNTESLDHSFEPFVRQLKLDDFYVVYEVNAYTGDARRMYQTYSDLHKNILDAFEGANIEILSPHYRVERAEQVWQSLKESGKSKKS